jgi:hypothetical protein
LPSFLRNPVGFNRLSFALVGWEAQEGIEREFRDWPGLTSAFQIDFDGGLYI